MPGQIPAQYYTATSSGAPYLAYTGTCCPAGQVPQPSSSLQTSGCLPSQLANPFPAGGGRVWGQIQSCPGAGDFNPGTNTCCPAGSLVTNRYTCCPVGQYPHSDGTCGCPPADLTLGDGSCAPLCKPNQIPIQGTAYCQNCPSGQMGTALGICCSPNQATINGGCCPPGFHAEAQGTSCVQNTTMRSHPSNCPPGQTRQDNGMCGVRPPVETPGAGLVPKISVPSDNPQPCGNGLVPRDAFRGDGVCVTQAVHDQAIADNIAAPSRTLSSGLCVRGYLWRRARTEDHTCVLPATREETQLDNQLDNQRQCGGDLHCKSGVTTSPKTTVTKTTVEKTTVEKGPVEHRTKLVFRPRHPGGGQTLRPSRHTSNVQHPTPNHVFFRGGNRRH